MKHSLRSPLVLRFALLMVLILLSYLTMEPGIHVCSDAGFTSVEVVWYALLYTERRTCSGVFILVPSVVIQLSLTGTLFDGV